MHASLVVALGSPLTSAARPRRKQASTSKRPSPRALRLTGLVVGTGRESGEHVHRVARYATSRATRPEAPAMPQPARTSRGVWRPSRTRAQLTDSATRRNGHGPRYDVAERST